MDLSKMAIFQMVNKRMDWLSQRQKVLSENVANADTPKYNPKDLKPIDFRTMVRTEQNSLKPSQTSPMHLAGTKPVDKFKAVVERPKDAYEINPQGNSVVLEDQMLKVNETAREYQLSANLYQKHIGMIRAAIGRGQ
jgi:flagellar basal-body rod protein FlgB